MGEALFRLLEYGLFFGVVIGLARPLGFYLSSVFTHKSTLIDPILVPIERSLHSLLRTSKHEDMSSSSYIVSFVLFGFFSSVFLFALLMIQRALPGGPSDQFLSTPVTPDLAANIAISFATTTTWQPYAGETTLRYLFQTIGLVSQNFLAGSAGLAVGMAFIRGFARERSSGIGNFWVDLIRAFVWVLLPFSLVGSIVLLAQGVPLNIAPYVVVHTLEGQRQVIPQGPVAVLEFIKNLGTNGGGFFNANGAHPYENPTPLTSFIALVAIAAIPAASTVAFGQMTGKPRAGWILLGMMTTLFVCSLALCDASETAKSPLFSSLHLVGGNMEGKEVRFGIGDSVLNTIVTSSGATGSNNGMMDSYRPLGVLAALANLLLGDISFGGLGGGLMGIVMATILAAFLGGQMIGRTPSYLGKRIDPPEMKLAVLYALVTPLVVLALGAVAVVTHAGLAGITSNPGARGLTEALFAYATSTANNGLSLAGLNANSPFYNLTTSLAMLAGRYGLTAFALALAGRFAAQGRLATTAGTLPDDTVQFAALVLGTIVLFGGLCFLPALVLGPLLEAFSASP